MHIFMRAAAQFAEILSFGIRLSMCLTARKQRAYIPQGNALKIDFFLCCAAAHGRVQRPTPGHTALFGLKTLSSDHPLVAWRNISGSWARVGGGAGCEDLGGRVHVAPPPPGPTRQNTL